MERVSQCILRKPTPIILEKFELHQPTRQHYVVNAVLNITENIDSNPIVRFHIAFKTKCSRTNRFATKKLNNNEKVINFFQFKMYASSCSLSMTECEDIDTIAIPNVCGRLTDRNAVWTPTFDLIKPPLRCPLRQVNRTLHSLCNTLSCTLIHICIGQFTFYTGYVHCEQWNF